MQDCENTGDTQVYHTLKETLFEGTGYSKNTGGRMENLRSLNVETGLKRILCKLTFFYFF